MSPIRWPSEEGWPARGCPSWMLRPVLLIHLQQRPRTRSAWNRHCRRCSCQQSGLVRLLTLHRRRFYAHLSSTSPLPSNGLIKVDAATGVLDTTLGRPHPDGPINSLLFEAGSLYVGGSFSTYRDKTAMFSAVLDPASGASQDLVAF